MTTTEQRDKRVMDFLREWHGADPKPLRSYLTQQESRDLMDRHPGAKQVAADLDIKGYAGKWRNAVEDGIRAERKPETWEFWHRARLAFLEYGGDYLEGQRPPDRHEALRGGEGK